MAAYAQHGLLIDRKIVDHYGVSQCLDLARHLLPAMPDIAGALTKRLDQVADATGECAQTRDQEAKVILETLRRVWSASARRLRRPPRSSTRLSRCLDVPDPEPTRTMLLARHAADLARERDARA